MHWFHCLQARGLLSLISSFLQELNCIENATVNVSICENTVILF
ncbi:hypothetical protein NC653_034085 [Populus alba x Populus x berolinensis]|uniref:Uncharacterized protein n=1 Tax=Populus alba x Populus x berolinensis TaxID=444605 RepID=A0AAD6LLQ1_9ROSI|nr:hypothetical protein NC653_034085 [Populus alba x Populus x berolinensis]